MLDPKKIPLVRVKEAFNLKENERDGLIDALWPHHVYPWELWDRAYYKFWRSIAISNEYTFKIKNPPYPDMSGIWADASVDRWRSQMYSFFSELGYAIPVDCLQKGLDYILSETYEDSSTVFPAEREQLFAKLTEAERGFNWYNAYPLDTEKLETMLNDKAYYNLRNSYHFISWIFYDTMIVDKLAAVRHLLICEYPFHHEVKGLTWDYVNRVKAALAAENPIVFPPAVAQQGNSSGPLQDNPPASAMEEFEHKEDAILIPRALWENKEPNKYVMTCGLPGIRMTPQSLMPSIIGWASKT